MEGKASCSCGQDSLNVIHILKMVSLLKKFNSKKHKAKRYSSYQGKGLLKKIKRLLHFRYTYFRYILAKQFGIFTEVKAKLFFGKQLILPISDGDAFLLYCFGTLSYEEESLTQYLIKNLKKNDVFYDVGANYGFYTFLADEIIETGQVYSFEPNSKVFEYLSTNAVGYDQITLNKVAVSNTSGEGYLFDAFEKHKSATSTIIEGVVGEGYSKKTIKTISLDDYIGDKQVTVPTLIKIDVEGAEAMVLEGASNVITTHRPDIIMEVWGGERGKQFSSHCLQLLKRLGYTNIYKINREGELIRIPQIDFSEVNNFGNFIFKSCETS
tara:strand:- start:55 stop:1029 length:975 start_codon:yes stop_codon:yes gene_type:complete